MKRKSGTVLLTALLVLSCIVVFAACSDMPTADSGDNGDNPPVVTPGDPDEEPDTPGDPDAPHEHTYTDEVSTQPTCTQEGVMTYTCTCGDSYTESIPMTAHIEVIDEAVAPTCTKTGLTEGKHCSVCGTVLVEQEVVPTTEHNYIDGFCDDCGAEREPTEGLEFKLSDDGTQYSVTDYTGTATQVYIPSVYEGLPVTSISRYAFSSAAYIDEIIIPASLTWIEPFAFAGCRSLTSFTVNEDSLSYCVIDDILFSKDQRSLICYPAKKEGATYQIPNGVEAVFNSAFEGTQNLSHVTIPDSVTILATYAFYNSSLTSVIIGNGIEEILLSVFENCTNLKNVQFGSGLIRIWDSAFRFCSNLESIVIPEGVTSIGNGVFMNCMKLVNITIPDSVTSIGQYAFERTAYYKDEANWENGILYVGNHVIKADYNVESSPSIREGTKTIADFAFSDCSHLIAILIPNSVISIGKYTFSDCTSFGAVLFEDPEGWHVAQTEGATDGTELASEDLSDPSTAAEYLTDTYGDCYWYKR